jgi:hypothetical protein
MSNKLKGAIAAVATAVDDWGEGPIARARPRWRVSCWPTAATD